MDRIEALRRGRQHYAGRRWQDAHQQLAAADADAPLDPPDLERLATAGYLTGRSDQYVAVLDRAYHGYLDSGAVRPAVRCGFWVGAMLALAGQHSPASGWFARAQRLLERIDEDCAERGYLLLPQVLERVAAADWPAVATTAATAAQIAERHRERDLFALAVHEQGHALARLGRVQEGFRLLDEAMLAAVGGELSPVVTGLVYCGVIAYCQDLYEVRRAREWTAALTRWCEQQPQLVAFTGRCLVHRAEIMQLGGTWADALQQAREACRKLAPGTDPGTLGLAFYRQGELHRLRGEYPAAETAYRQASRHAWDPQPGLALLRLAQGDQAAAAAAVRRALGERPEPLAQAALLPAAIEIALAAGEVETARDGCRRLAEIADQHPSTMLAAASGYARGTLALADGDPPTALVALRQAWQLWQQLVVPYEAARVRVQVGLACRAVGDEDAAALEFDAARGTFAQLGAAPDLAALDSVAGARAGAGGDDSGRPPGPRLTARELEVLRLVAAGRSNRAIAGHLVVSERTVERHVSNILAKLAVPSRAAATAYAYQQHLV